ncbi:hypothetical protein AVEN_10176-1 [Araneus ventricosus]|uniref:STPR domain-containing protein n=1 Tax=Araneus ventricosus TaxID=182803 RepID=A0A4Y2BVV0_ARAVE|nr:hypothetical protein AVEN_10176-1 [Araneus ventricosus]
MAQRGQDRREEETEEQRNSRLSDMAQRRQERRAEETEEQRNRRLAVMGQRSQQRRAVETEEQRKENTFWGERNVYWNQKANGFYFTAERRDVQLHRRLHGHVAGNLPGGSLRFCGDPGVPGHLHVQEQEEGEGSAQLLTFVVSAIHASIRCVKKQYFKYSTE